MTSRITEDIPRERPTIVGLYFFKGKTEIFYPIYNLQIHPGSSYKYLFLKNWFPFASKFLVPLILNESILYGHFLLKPREGIIPLMKMAFTIERCTCKLKPYLVTELFIRAIMTLKISILPSTVGKCSFILNNSLNHFVP